VTESEIPLIVDGRNIYGWAAYAEEEHDRALAAESKIVDLEFFIDAFRAKIVELLATVNAPHETAPLDGGVGNGEGEKKK
jgi:hypothetical protein